MKRLHRWLLLLLGGLLFVAWAWANQWPTAVLATDLNQHRANRALPALQGETAVQQTFRPAHDGLAEVEVLLVGYGETAEEEDGRLTLQLFDEAGMLVAEREVATAGLAHNQTFVLRFKPQPDSAGRQYRLQISGNEANPISVWGYDLDVHAGGSLALTEGETTAQDLRMVTRYRLTPGVALASLGEMLGREGALMVLALLFMLMPGCLLLLAGGRWLPRWDGAAWLGVALALGLSVWPLLWMWLTVMGGRWTGWLLWLVLAVGWGLVPWLKWGDFGFWILDFGLPRSRRFRQEGRFTNRLYASRSIHWQHIALLVLLLLSMAVRLLAVRDLAFPAWVDSSRHALITAVMAENGRAIQSYEPLLAIDRFPYHFGFHTISASLLLMTERPLPALLLLLGQLLNGLMPLAVYTAGWLLTRRRNVGLVAAFLVALPFFFPAYYATWGRMTQLTAMLVMAAAIGLTWQLGRGPKRARGVWWLVATLAAGLFLIHFRVFLLYVPFAALVWLVSLGRNGRRLAMAAGLALLLVGPRMVQLAADTQGVVLESGADSTYNDFPIAYVNTGWERPFLGLALLGLVISLPAAARRRRWALLPPLLAMWVGVVLLSLSGRRLGLPESWLINLNSAYITFFLPVALVIGAVAAEGGRWLQRGHWLGQVVGYTATGAAVAAALLFGVRQQVTILNAQTILAETADRDGLAWLAANAPAEAKVAVNSWRWLGVTWAGSDGGAWLLPLTGRQGTTPPADYIYSRPLAAEVNAFNEQAMAVEDWSGVEAAEWLREQGVTYVYVGARGGFLDPVELAANQALRLIYRREGVFIWEIGD